MRKSAVQEGSEQSSLPQWGVLSPDELMSLIKACASNDRQGQKKLYYSFYSYAMSICQRYTNNYDDSVEILNDGFLKIFKEIHQFKPAYTDVLASFMGWLRKIMIYTSIDHFRKNSKHKFTAELDDGLLQASATREDAVDKISYDEIISLIQELTPSYRTVLNLFIIEGFTHEEISTQLGISLGTSKSNLARGRLQLQKKLLERNQVTLTRELEQAEIPEAERPHNGLQQTAGVGCS